MDNKHRPFIIKKHDTLPSLTIKIKARDCINAEVSFNLSQAQITSASAGTVQYYWTTDDTDTVGQYKGEFELLFNDGNKLSIPSLGYIDINIVSDLNDL